MSDAGPGRATRLVLLPLAVGWEVGRWFWDRPMLAAATRIDRVFQVLTWPIERFFDGVAFVIRHLLRAGRMLLRPVWPLIAFVDRTVERVVAWVRGVTLAVYRRVGAVIAWLRDWMDPVVRPVRLMVRWVRDQLARLARPLRQLGRWLRVRMASVRRIVREAVARRR